MSPEPDARRVAETLFESMQRATPRKYSDELKAEFLRLVVERQIISTVA